MKKPLPTLTIESKPHWRASQPYAVAVIGGGEIWSFHNTWLSAAYAIREAVVRNEAAQDKRLASTRSVF